MSASTNMAGQSTALERVNIVVVPSDECTDLHASGLVESWRPLLGRSDMDLQQALSNVSNVVDCLGNRASKAGIVT